MGHLIVLTLFLGSALVPLLLYILLYRDEIEWDIQVKRYSKILLLLGIMVLINVLTEDLYIFWFIVIPSIFAYYGLKKIRHQYDAVRSTGLILMVVALYLYLPIITYGINYFFPEEVAKNIIDVILYVFLGPIILGTIFFIPILGIYFIINLIRHR